MPSGFHATGQEPSGSSGGVCLRPGLIVNVAVIVGGSKEVDEIGRRVSDGGMLSLPLLGSTEVKDLTLEELSSALTVLYRQYYVNPQVIVEFNRDTQGVSAWGYVTVLGRVKTPGPVAIPATRDLTVSGAIQRAGGFNTSAQSGSVRVTRRGMDATATARNWEIDLGAVGAEGRAEDDIIVNAGDMIFVPERKF